MKRTDERVGGGRKNQGTQLEGGIYRGRTKSDEIAGRYGSEERK